MAVHDFYYASPAPDWDTFMLRMHLIAEERIGAALRREGAMEDAKASRAMMAAEGV